MTLLKSPCTPTSGTAACLLFGGGLVRPGGSTSLGNTADDVIGYWSIAAESN